MLKKIKALFKHTEQREVLLLRILLLAIVVAIAYLIFSPRDDAGGRTFSKKIMVNGNETTFDKPFVMTTTDLCNTLLENKITNVADDSIDMTFLKKQKADRTYEPLNPEVNHRIRNGDCIEAYSLCSNMNFQYCFTIKTEDDPVTIDYVVKQK
ncbi:hypothetical protein BH09PAT2_BH09PAT2_07020 [soil metagenome]